MNIRVLFFGQSNAGFLAADGPRLAAAVEQDLGFDGASNSVDMIGGVGVSAVPGLPLLPTPFANPGVQSWLTTDPADAALPFGDRAAQQALLSTLRALPPAGDTTVRTFIVTADGETDSLYPGITPQEWAGATAFAVGQDRAALGLTEAEAPVLFLKVPYDEQNPTSILATYLDGGSAQAIQQGMQLLIDQPAFGASWGAWDEDANMDLNGPYGDQHFDAVDQSQAIGRLARSIADLSAPFAEPGSPVAGGPLDDAGPAVASATNVPGQPDQVDVRLALAPGSDALQALSEAAAMGAGWSARHGGTTLAATSAELLPGGTTLRLTFAASVPTDGSMELFYGAGSGRIAVGGGPGQGAAVYDDQGLPLQGTPEGVSIAPAGVTVPTPSGPYPMVFGGAATDSGTALNPVVTLGDGGSDTVVADPSNQAVALEVDGGTGGTALVYGGAGFLRVNGGLGAVQVIAGAGDVVATGGTGGANTLDGGAGSATFYAEPGDTIVGGSGTTTAWFIGSLSGGAAASAPATFFGGAGSATVGTIATVNLTVVSGAGDVTVTGSAGGNDVWGGSGTTLFFSRDGTDMMACGAGTLDVYAGAGTETDFGGNEASSQLNVTGGSGASVVVGGGQGSVVFDGGSGAATVWAAGGTTTVNGGAGADFIGGATDSAASLFVNGGAGDQTVFADGGTTTIDEADVAATTRLLFVGGAGAATIDSGAGTLEAFAGARRMLVTCDGAGGSTIVASSGSLDVAADTTAGITSLIASTGDITANIGGGGPLALVVAKGAAGGTDLLNGFRTGVDEIFLSGFSRADLSAATDLGGGMSAFTLSGGPEIVLPSTAADPGAFTFG